MAAQIHLCVLVLFIQCIATVFGCGWGCGHPGYGAERFGYGGWGYGGGYGYRPTLDVNSLASSRSSELVVTSRSPKAPTGISVKSDNSITGDLAVTGTLPFLAAVAFDGALPNEGCGTVAYNCGDGEVGIKTEERIGSGYGYGGRYGGRFGGGCGGGCGGGYENNYGLLM